MWHWLKLIIHVRSLFLPQQTEIEKTQNKLTKLKESHDEEKANLEKQKESETSELKKQLEAITTTLDAERTQSQEAKDIVQKLTTEAENSKVHNFVASLPKHEKWAELNIFRMLKNIYMGNV